MIAMLLYAAMAGGGTAPAQRTQVARPVMVKAACEASLALIRSQVAMRGDRVIYTEWKGADRRDFDPGDDRWSATPYAKAHHVAAPSGRRIKRTHRLDNLAFSAVHHCPSVRRFLDRRHIAFGADATDLAVRRQDAKVTFLSVSLAAVDASGQRAVVTFGSTGLLGGGGWATTLVRDSAGRWHPAYSTPTWIT